MASVTLTKINKAYGPVHILRDIDLTIENGEFVVFVGPSGCGKSTLLRLIAGLEEISAGDLHIGGDLVNHLSPKERGVGMVFQSYALYPHMTVYENIAFGLKLAKEKPQTVHERVSKTAEVLQLEALLERKPKEMSGGQRQRVAIGRAMAREPRIMLFDEPLSNLDASLRVQMRTEIAKLHQRLKSTMVYVTHDQVEAMTLADKIVVLNAGRVEQVGTPYELYENPASVFVAGFIGSPKMNFIHGTLLSSGGSQSRISIAGAGEVVAAIDSSGLQTNAQVTLGVRPEHLALRPATDQDDGLEVINVEYLGNESFAYLQHPCADELLVARAPAYTSIKVGDLVTLEISPELTYLFDDAGLALPRTRLTEQSREVVHG